MNTARTKHRLSFWGALIFLGVTLIGFGLQGCQYRDPTVDNVRLSPSTINDTTPQPFSFSEEIHSSQGDNSVTDFRADDYHPIWGNYPPPSIDPATPIPPPFDGLVIDDEILSWVILGSDIEPPYTGRTQAIHLLFIHPRFSKASVVSIPGDLYVYIPGYTMQRLNTAYALGGIETLRETLAYNFGVRPSRFVLAHPGDFQWLVDDINTIDVTVFYPIPQYCGGVRAGLVRMDGALALCYASYRDGMDEFDRMRRQQQLMRVIFRKFTQDGNLIQLPMLYASYDGWIKTDLSLAELMRYIPLALRLGDLDRISYSMIDWEQVKLWNIPGHSQAQVFLPDQASILEVLQQAIDFVLTPEPLTNQVQTLEAQLTAVYQKTVIIVSTPTPTPTLTPTPDLLTPSPTPTPTLTPEGYP